MCISSYYTFTHILLHFVSHLATPARYLYFLCLPLRQRTIKVINLYIFCIISQAVPSGIPVSGGGGPAPAVPGHGGRVPRQPEEDAALRRQEERAQRRGGQLLYIHSKGHTLSC